MGAQRWLKGGYAMELRIKEARTTKDIDFIIEDPKSLKKHYERNLRNKSSGIWKTFLFS